MKLNGLFLVFIHLKLELLRNFQPQMKGNILFYKQVIYSKKDVLLTEQLPQMFALKLNSNFDPLEVVDGG